VSSSSDQRTSDPAPDIADLSDELIARPTATQEMLETIMASLERIEAKLDGVWREGPNPL
jgi:hypothetical protein